MANERGQFTIAVLDPNPGDAASISQLLSGAGFRVVAPPLNDSVLDELEAQSPDLVIADPFALGWDSSLRILLELRRRPRTRRIPLIVSTEDSTAAFLLHGTLSLLLKANVLLKPFTAQQLLAMVENLVPGSSPSDT